ncbi:MAG: hypothetical protein MJ196_10005 [Treponemataceae bacterium]|nr:hypothetical protein [Treponemataceae bacterium]
MDFPVPAHLKEYLILDESEQTEFEVSGSIKCTCGGHNFEVLSSNRRLFVKLHCHKCGNQFVLFDAGKHGWNGFVCKDDYINREEPLEKYQCSKCRNGIFNIKLNITSQGRQDFIDECAGSDDSFAEDEWVNAFEWIKIGLNCSGCQSKEADWLDAETM